MKTITLLAILIAVGGFAPANFAENSKSTNNATGDATPPGLKKKGGVPPGLQKKGGLPPGQAKKRGQEPLPADVLITNPPPADVVVTPRTPVPIKRGDAPTRPVVTSKPEPATPAPNTTASAPVPATTPPPAPAPGSATPPAPATPPQPAPATNRPLPTLTRPTATQATATNERELRAQTLRLNVAMANTKTRRTALERIATETGASVEALEAQAKANPKLIAGDLLMANKIAALAGKPVNEVITAHKQRKMWLAVGEQYSIPAQTLNDTAKRVDATFR